MTQESIAENETVASDLPLFNSMDNMLATKQKTTGCHENLILKENADHT